MPTFTGTSGNDRLVGTSGDDIINGLAGDDVIFGAEGDDVIDAGSDNDTVDAGDGNDRIIVYQYANAVEGGNGRGRSIIDGGAGFDTLEVRPGTAGAYTYTALASSPETIRVALASAPDRIVAEATSVERITGAGLFDFSLRTTPIQIIATGASTIIGGRGEDVLTGSSGVDIMTAGAGDRVNGLGGDDTITLEFGALSAATTTFAFGGEGRDTLNLNLGGSTAALSIDMSVQSPLIGNVRVDFFEIYNFTLIGGDFSFTGTRFAETVSVLGRPNATLTINGGLGDDVISVTGGRSSSVLGGAGDDTIYSFTTLETDIPAFPGYPYYTGIGRVDGGAGNDTISGLGVFSGGAGDDQFIAFSGGNRYENTSYGELDGGDGSDTIVLQVTTFPLNTQGWNFSLETGLASNLSGLRPASTQYVLRSIENIVGSSNHDTLTGDGANNRIEAGLGNDTVRGGGGSDILYGDLAAGGTGGNDSLFGDDGDDIIHGGAGDDLLDGGAGDDYLVGGTGADTFVGGQGIDVAALGYSYNSAIISYDGDAIVVASAQGSERLTGIERIVFSDAVLTVGADGRVSTTLAPSITGTQGNDTLTGTANNEILFGLGGADTLRGGAGDDGLSGGDGNDVLIGGAGSDALDGGAGVDTAVYSGNLLTYSRVSQDRVSGGEEGGTDYLTSVEVLRFLDGRLSFDTSDATSVVYRLYDAAFDRAPDVFGLADYSRAISEGRSTVQDILNAFSQSQEFYARYGTLTNDQFVREMYRFSLNREGDSAGVAGYVAALDAGTTNRAQILGIFSESQEHQALVNAVITAQGIFVQDERTASVARLYDSVFNRLPDLGGLKGYRDALDNGYTLRDITTAMVGSPEFQARFGNLSNQQFVEQIYRFVLDREGDAAGIRTYVQALDNGTTNRVDLVLIFSDSLEHRINYQATYDLQIRYLGVNGYDPSGTGVGRAAEADPGKHADAFVLPAEPAFEVAHHDDAVAVLETAANDHVLIDDAMVGSWMLLDPVIATDDPSVGHHRSDWM